MQLRLQLHAKFPETPEDDILKVVGNLLYYRYMNPAIVAPDGFDIVDVGMEQQLSPDQVGCLEGRERGREGGREGEMGKGGVQLFDHERATGGAKMCTLELNSFLGSLSAAA